MRKLPAILAAILCFITMAAVGIACSDNDDAKTAVEEEEMTDTEPDETPPTEDALTTKTNVKAYVFDGTYGNIGKKVLARITNRQSEIDSTTQLIFMPADKYATLSRPELDRINAAYNNGTKILVDRPTIDEMTQMAYSLLFGPSSELNAETAPNDEEREMWGISLSPDVFVMDIPLNDSTDTSAANRAVLTNYEEGLYADAAANWVNTDQNASAQTRMQVAATRANASLSDILEAQTETWVASVSAQRFDRLRGKQAPYVVFTAVYAVHKFSTDTDYFLVDQTLSGNNSTFWLGEWKQKSYEADFDNSRHNWRMQGFYVNNWELDNCMTIGDTRHYVTLSDGLTLVKHSPVSTNASITTSTSTSWNIGGDIGSNGASFTGGISGSVGSSQTLMDISTVDKCMKKTTCENNAWWQYTIDPLRQIKKSLKFSFRKPPKAAIETFQCEQSWLWELKNASRYDDLYLCTNFKAQFFRTLIRNPFICYAGYENGTCWNDHSFKISLPKRSK